MHTYIPPRKSKLVLIVTGLFFLTATLLIVLAATVFKTTYPFIFHIAAVVSLVCGIQIFTRYYLKVYKYVVSGDAVNYFADELNRISQVNQSGGTVLKIICMQGKAENTVGGFSIDSVVEVKKTTDGPLERKDSIKHSFDFSNNLSKDDKYTVVALINDEYVSITLEPDNTILDLLKNAIKIKSE